MTRKKVAAAFTMAFAVLLLGTKALSSREVALSTPTLVPSREASPDTVLSRAPALRLLVTSNGNSARYLVREQLVGFDLPNDAIGTTNDVSGAWRGNVRELGNALERAAILADGSVVRGDDLQVSMMMPPENAAGTAGTMEEIERQAIERALEESSGNRRRAAERLGIGERTRYEKIKRCGIT